MRNDQSASEVKIKFKTREGFWHKIDEFPDESKNGRKKSNNVFQRNFPLVHVCTILKDSLRYPLHILCSISRVLINFRRGQYTYASLANV